MEPIMINKLIAALVFKKYLSGNRVIHFYYLNPYRGGFLSRIKSFKTNVPLIKPLLAERLIFLYYCK